MSFYIETQRHKLLVDLGPSEETLKNAAALNIDLTAVDTVILSHGHYDHSGGILSFAGINDHAKIYMQRTAPGDYFADDGEAAEGERYRYIGIDKKITGLAQIVYADGDHMIDDELELFTVKEKAHEIPFTNKRLLQRTGDGFIKDTFEHEQYLVIRSEGRTVLVSGCAHNGIPNIMDAYIRRYNTPPDIVISGFHLMKKTEYSGPQLDTIRGIAEELAGSPTRFITCHCTGTEAYMIMKDIMKDRLEYVHSGEEIFL